MNEIFNRRNQGGFTLIELLMALMVSAIILAAVASICQAMGTGQDVCEQMGTNQAKIRFVSIYIPELVRNSVYLWDCDWGSIAIWKQDTNGNHRVEGNELVYLQQNLLLNKIQILEAPGNTSAVSVGDIQNESQRLSMAFDASQKTMTLVNGCSNISFEVRNNKLLIIQFELAEETGQRDYQIVTARRGSADAWFDSSGALVGGDDD